MDTETPGGSPGVRVAERRPGRRSLCGGRRCFSTPDPSGLVADVLADLLSRAAETGQLMEALQLLRSLAGPAMVRAAVGVCIDRRREVLAQLDARARAPGADRGPGRPGPAPPAGHRDTTPKAPAERSGSQEDASGAALHLVRRLPDPLRGGPAGQADR